MRSVARQHDEELPPGPREDPRVRAATLGAQYEAVLGLLRDTGNEDLILEVVGLHRRYTEHTRTLEKLLADRYGEERAFAAGAALGESRAAARQQAPAPRHAAGRRALLAWT